jgi:NTE family protein
MTAKLSKIGLALGGGAAKGLAHIGVLEVLEEYQIEPDFIAGTSAGALIGGLYAGGLTVARMKELVQGIDRRQVMKLLDFSFRRGYIVDGKHIEDFLEELVGDVRLEELKIPFIAVATDVITGRGLYINKGRLVDAIRASISIPGIFKPVEANRTLYVDGGIRENLPLSVLRQFKPDILIGINVLKTYPLDMQWSQGGLNLSDKESEDHPDAFWESIKHLFHRVSDKPTRKTHHLAYMLSRTFGIIMNEMSQLEIETSNPDLVIHLDMSAIELWDFWKGPEAVKIGYSQAKPVIARFVKG